MLLCSQRSYNLIAENHFEYAGACGGFLDCLGYPLARGRIFEITEEDHGQYDEPERIDWASGAAVLIRRSALQEVGLLDETFGLNMEEIDLCWRLRSAGYEIGVVPQSRVYHIGGATLSRQSARKLYYNIRNGILMLYKNLPSDQFKKIFVQRILFDYSISLAWLLTGRWKRVSAVIRGYLDAHRNATSLLITRSRSSSSLLPRTNSFRLPNSEASLFLRSANEQVQALSFYSLILLW